MGVRQIIAGGVAALAVAAGIGVGVGQAVQAPSTHGVKVTTTCQEDEACWDWRTMGNMRRGICVVDSATSAHDELEYADGHREAGGRGCEAAYEEAGAFANCVSMTDTLISQGIVLPVGWHINCREWPQERGLTTLKYEGRPVGGLTRYAEKTIDLDVASWRNDQDLQGAAAHEACHAIRFAQGRTSADYLTEERAADACARKAGFIVPNHGV
jgi:hypothetical protein